MDPIILLPVKKIAELSGGSLAEYISGKAFTYLTAKYQQIRLTHFFRQLILQYENEIKDGSENSQLDKILERFSTNDYLTDLLSQAARQVSLSLSREIGPKITAILISKIQNEERVANEIENLMLSACERLSDGDLRWFSKHFKMRERNIELLTDQTDPPPKVGPLLKHIGERAPSEVYRLGSLGLVHFFTHGDTSPEGELTRVTWVHSSDDLKQFVELIDRATGPSESV